MKRISHYSHAKRDSRCRTFWNAVILTSFLLLLTIPGKIVLAQNSSILPTAKEIYETNSRLPVQVADGLMWIRVDYDTSTKTEKFIYKFVNTIDHQTISSAIIKQRKRQMMDAMRQRKGSMDRINSGMTYKYIYYTKDNTKLYEININKADF